MREKKVSGERERERERERRERREDTKTERASEKKEEKNEVSQQKQKQKTKNIIATPTTTTNNCDFEGLSSYRAAETVAASGDFDQREKERGARRKEPFQLFPLNLSLLSFLFSSHFFHRVLPALATEREPAPIPEFAPHLPPLPFSFQPKKQMQNKHKSCQFFSFWIANKKKVDFVFFLLSHSKSDKKIKSAS